MSVVKEKRMESRSREELRVGSREGKKSCFQRTAELSPAAQAAGEGLPAGRGACGGLGGRRRESEHAGPSCCCAAGFGRPVLSVQPRTFLPSLRKRMGGNCC